MTAKQTDIKNLIDFSIQEDRIISQDKTYYFYRFYPPNLSILTTQEKEIEIDALCNFLEAMQQPLLIFAMDKVEDLSKNKQFFQTQTLPEYQAYTAQIIEQISSYEVSENQTNSIQRAYYFVIEVTNKDDKRIFEDALRLHRLKHTLVLKEELITIARNFYIREFSSFDLYVFHEEVLKKHDN